jgi:hypothetical protein
MEAGTAAEWGKEEKRTLHWQIKNNTVARKKGERETQRAWILQPEGPVCSPSCEKIQAELQIR